jgi:hypothetical protein
VYADEDETAIVARLLPQTPVISWSQAGDGWVAVTLQAGVTGFVKTPDLPRLKLPKPKIDVELP